MNSFRSIPRDRASNCVPITHCSGSFTIFWKSSSFKSSLLNSNIYSSIWKSGCCTPFGTRANLPVILFFHTLKLEKALEACLAQKAMASAWLSRSCLRNSVQCKPSSETTIQEQVSTSISLDAIRSLGRTVWRAWQCEIFLLSALTVGTIILETMKVVMKHAKKLTDRVNLSRINKFIQVLPSQLESQIDPSLDTRKHQAKRYETGVQIELAHCQIYG